MIVWFDNFLWSDYCHKACSHRQELQMFFNLIYEVLWKYQEEGLSLTGGSNEVFLEKITTES